MEGHSHSIGYKLTDAQGIISAAEDKEKLAALIEELSAANERFGFRTSSPECDKYVRQQQNAWRGSIAMLGRIFREAGLHEEHPVILEMMLEEQRKIDVVLCGMNEEKQPSAMIMECKAHHNRRRGPQHTYRYDVLPSHDPEKYISFFMDHPLSQPEAPLARVNLKPHLQVWRYLQTVREKIAGVAPDQLLAVQALLYFYNMSELTKRWQRTLFSELSNEICAVPFFTKRENPDLAVFLKKFAGNGNGEEALEILRKTSERELGANGTDLRRLLKQDQICELDRQRIESYQKWYIETARPKKRRKKILVFNQQTLSFEEPEE